MKKVICVLTASLFIVASAKSQGINYGINSKISMATLLEKNPQKKSDGTTQYNSLSTWGLNAFLEKKFNSIVSSVFRAGYNQKGFALPVQTMDDNFNQVNRIQENRMHYLNMDMAGRLHFCHKGVQPYVQAGLRGEYLIGKRIGSAGFLPSEYEHLRNFDLGVIASTGITMQDIVSLDLEANLDVLGPVYSTSLVAKNLILTFNIEININKLIKPKA